MKLLLGIAGLIGSIALGATHAPATTAASAAPAVAVVDHGVASVTQPDADLVCTPVWVCDEPYAVFSSLAACRASGCTVQCSYEGQSCNP